MSERAPDRDTTKDVNPLRNHLGRMARPASESCRWIYGHMYCTIGIHPEETLPTPTCVTHWVSSELERFVLELATRYVCCTAGI
jgi:hypothetical protein